MIQTNINLLQKRIIIIFVIDIIELRLLYVDVYGVVGVRIFG